MHSRAYRFTWALVAILGSFTLMPRLHAEDTDPAALAAALTNAPATLGKGLQASEWTGKRITAKFEIEDGKLQLSIYTTAADGLAVSDGRALT
jgi:hypothetical protein